MISADYLGQVFLGNTGEDYIIALGIFLGTLIVLQIFKLVVVSRLEGLAKKLNGRVSKMIAEYISEIPIVFHFLIALYISLNYLVLHAGVKDVLNHMLFILAVIFSVRGINKVIKYFIQREIEKKKTENKESSMLRLLERFIHILVWIVAILLVMSNLGINITSLVAGLGIGGIAIAFALQRILEDIFSSFSIYFDKPFEEGDFIIIGQDMGVVKSIGLKSTRIQTLQGQELIISNKEITSVRINNYKRMENRRIVFSFGVVYDTSVKKLERILEIVREIIGKIELAELNRVHFKEFGSSSLNFEVVYYINSSDYNKYMDIQQEINMGLKRMFEKEKIEFAFPTQTIYLRK